MYSLSSNKNDTIVGLISSNENIAIEYVSIRLLNSDGKLIASSISDSIGTFSLKFPVTSAKYPLMLKLNHIEYKDKQLTFNYDDKQPIIINMDRNEHSLTEVTVRGRWIFHKDGNLVVNVNQVPGVQNFQADKLLKLLPGVTKSSNGGYELNGKSIVFYINDVKQNITNQSLNALFGSLPASILSEIELVEINNGKYPADSNNAVVNIKTKNKFINGYSHQIRFSAGVFRKGVESLKPSYFFMTKKNRWLFYNSLAFSDDNYYSKSSDSTHYNNGSMFHNNRTNGGMYPCLQYNAKLTYTLPNENQLDFSSFIYYDFGHIHSSLKSDSYDENKSEKLSDLYYRRFENDDLWSGTLTYIIPNNNKYIYGSTYYNVIYGGLRSNNDYYDSVNDNKFQTSNLKMTGWMNTFGVDLQSEFSKVRLIYGLNLQYNWMNDKAIYDYQGNGLNYNSKFFGREILLSAYAGAYYKVSDKLTFSTSIRTENTNYKLAYKTEEYQNDKKYMDLFPSILGYYTSVKYDATFGLISGIERPKYEYMIPGKRKVNESYFTLGNPNLSPSHSYSIIYNNTFYKFVYLNLRYSYYKNASGAVYYNKDGLLYQDYLNYVNLENYNISLSIPFKLLKDKLYGQASGRWTYVNNKTFINDFTPPVGRKTKYWINSYNFSMSYDITDRLNINTYISYKPKFESMQNYTYSYTDTEASISYGFCNKKNLFLEFSISNILDSRDIKHNIYFANNVRCVNIQRNGPIFNLSLRLKLNKGEKITDEYKEYSPNISRLQK
jgi:hypothetical protein